MRNQGERKIGPNLLWTFWIKTSGGLISDLGDNETFTRCTFNPSMREKIPMC